MNSTLNGREKSKKVRVGIIGAGKMGLHHLSAIHQNKLGEIVGIVDPEVKKEKLDEIIGSNYSLFRAIDDFLKETDVDVVHICTPPQTHYNIAKKVLENDTHLYMEKPFTLRIKETDELFEIARNKSLKICAGHQLLFQDSSRNSWDLLKNIDKVTNVESYFSFHQVNRNITKVEQTIDILPHPVYLLLNFMEGNFKNNDLPDYEIKSFEVTSDGDVRALIKLGDVTGVLIVTLKGRPVDSYIKIVGTNGMLYTDYTLGYVRKHLGPGESTIALVIKPFSEAWQSVWGSAKAIYKRISKKQMSYHGLSELIENFYSSIINNTALPISVSSIRGTVKTCETIGDKLRVEEKKAEKLATEKLKKIETTMPELRSDSGIILITGGTGFLGRRVAQELRKNGWPVRVTARNIPPASNRMAGIEYVKADLGDTIPANIMTDVSVVVHCAAETSGGKTEHRRNSIDATQNIITAAGNNNVKKFIHISSSAVLKAGKGTKVLTENTPLDLSESRGPYVWGKASSEKIALDLGRELKIDVKVIRPGALVDYNDFDPPGRLGRELGNTYVAIGSKKQRLDVCDVNNAAKVISLYIEQFESQPSILNLIEPEPPTRGQLLTILKEKRPYLKIYRIPMIFLSVMNPALWLLQKILRPKAKPVNVKSAFDSVKFDTTLVKQVVRESNQIVNKNTNISSNNSIPQTV